MPAQARALIEDLTIGPPLRCQERAQLQPQQICNVADDIMRAFGERADEKAAIAGICLFADTQVSRKSWSRFGTAAQNRSVRTST
jgi:hypothetical protein